MLKCLYMYSHRLVIHSETKYIKTELVVQLTYLKTNHKVPQDSISHL